MANISSIGINGVYIYNFTGKIVTGAYFCCGIVSNTNVICSFCIRSYGGKGEILDALREVENEIVGLPPVFIEDAGFAKRLVPVIEFETDIPIVSGNAASLFPVAENGSLVISQQPDFHRICHSFHNNFVFVAKDALDAVGEVVAVADIQIPWNKQQNQT